MRIRSLTPAGMDWFTDFLSDLPSNPEFMNRKGEGLELSSPVPQGGEVQERSFGTKMELAQALQSPLQHVDGDLLLNDRGLWSWLALYYLDILLESASGGWIVRDSARYVLSPERRREYRHLIRGPWAIYRLHGNTARLLLTSPPYRWSDAEEQITAVQEIVRMPGAMGAADMLYFDDRRNTQKRGFTNRKKPGTLRRFAAVMQQLDLTYDLYSMNSEELVELLPPEFDRFRR
jgi:hypothetical protein